MAKKPLDQNPVNAQKMEGSVVLTSQGGLL